MQRIEKHIDCAGCELAGVAGRGAASRRYIHRHKRLKEYDESDLDLLLATLSDASEIVVTPNTLTETSNLIGYIDEPARTHVYKVFGRLIGSTSEVFVASDVAAGHPDFLRLGLTDVVLLSLPKDVSLLTADLHLYLSALRVGCSTVNFNHLREL